MSETAAPPMQRFNAGFTRLFDSFRSGSDDVKQIGVVPIADMHGMTMQQIAQVADDESETSLRDEITFTCKHCEKTEITCARFMAGWVACDECCEKHEEDEAMERVRKYWEQKCPKQLRDTDVHHDGFPAGIYRENKEYDGNSSLFLYGPSGSGKTRTAAMLCKRALLKGKQIEFLWPEELKSYAKDHINRLRHIQEYGSNDVLMLDDALLTGAQDERIADFLKDLIDFMQRHGNQAIITSQIGGDDYKEQANKFGNVTKTDLERIDALLRRIREAFTVIPFVSGEAAQADDGEMF